MGRVYGCLPVPEVERAAAPLHALTAANLPDTVDLRDTGLLPAVWDQGQLGACTAHGAGAAYSYELARQRGQHDYTPSRLFIYWCERSANGTIGTDSGATITDAVRALNQHGAPPETDWPYDIARFTETPLDVAFRDGATREAVKYARVPQTATGLKAVLAAGYPIIIGFQVYESYESPAVAQTGVVPMPQPGEQLLGGHCVLVVGYTPDSWIVRNSWGTSWGQGGYCTMPTAYLTDESLASDFWTVELVTTGTPQPPVKHRPWWVRLWEWLT